MDIGEEKTGRSERRTVEPIGRVVRDYRKGIGRTQVEFAAELGVDQSTISRLESRPSDRSLDPGTN
jgi:DNA-binding XRE family transcriptional regulator